MSEQNLSDPFFLAWCAKHGGPRRVSHVLQSSARPSVVDSLRLESS